MPTPKPQYRIALDARLYRSETGGLGRYSRELIDHLAQIDKTNQYTIFLTKKDAAEWKLKQDNFVVQVVSIPHFSVSEQTRMLRILNKGNFDLVHFLNFNHPVLYRRPFVTTLHDLTLYFFPSGQSSHSVLRKQAFRYVLRHSLKAAEKVIAISHYTAKDAHRQLGIPTNKMEIIYEGGPDPLKLPKNHQQQVQEYLKTDMPYFLFVSQWRPHKGIITLIEAYNDFRKKSGLDYKLVLLGNQKVATTAVFRALRLSPYRNDIIAPGFAPDDLLPALYHHATAFIVPSEYEGFGLPVLEAFTYETPVIVANNSSLPEVAGKGGLYFETKNSAELAEKMEQIISKPEVSKKLVENSKAQLHKFSWTKAARETLLTYLKVLEK